MNRHIKVGILGAIILLAATTLLRQITAPDPQPKISEDLSIVIGYMQDSDAWVFGRSAIFAYHPKSRIALYLSSYSSELRLGVSDVEHAYDGLVVPLKGDDGAAFQQEAVRLRGYLVDKRRPALNEYIGHLTRGGS